MVDIARMAGDLGIDEGELALILEVPEAMEAFRAKLAAADMLDTAVWLYNTTPDGGLAKKLAEERLTTVLAALFDNATSLKERCDAWSYAIPGSAFRRKTLEAILALPLTLEECDEFLQWSDDEEEDILITMKRLELLATKEAVIALLEERDCSCLHVVDSIQSAILKKLATFY